MGLELDEGQVAPHLLLDEAVRDLSEAEGEGDVLEDREVGKEGVVLEDGVAAPLVRREAVDLAAVDGYDAGVGILEARDDPEEGRLAAARGTEKGEELALPDLQRNVLQGLEAAEGLPKRRNGDVRTFQFREPP